MQFRKDINGLRAIAVIAVVLFHFNPSWLPGGFAGVDVFFVISGYLMTRIIFRSLENRNFSIFKFYIARANRIIPALAVLCTALLIFGWLFLTPLHYQALGKHVTSSLTFVSNIIYWKESGYFDASSHEKWLLHTWSLSVEWQFYIIYPLALVTLQKIMPFKALKAIILLGTILGFIFCVIATYKWPDPSYYLLITRAWEMMIGGIAYLYPFKVKNSRKSLIEFVGLALIISSYLFISKENYWPGYLSIFPVFGTFLIIQAQRDNSLITHNLVFQTIGSWSYSIYLWHWPIVVAIHHFSLNTTFVYLGIILSIILGFLSNKYIESIKFTSNVANVFDFLKYRPLYLVTVISILGVTIFKTDGVKSSIRYINNTDKMKLLTYYQEYAEETGLGKYWKLCNPESRWNKTGRYQLSEKCFETNTFSQDIFIWGDSHAGALSDAIREKYYNYNIHQVTASACSISIKGDTKVKGNSKKSKIMYDGCIYANKLALEKIQELKPKYVIMAQQNGHDKTNWQTIKNKLQHLGAEKVILLGPVPQWRPSLPQAIVNRHMTKNQQFINDHTLDETIIAASESLLLENTNEFTYINLTDKLCFSKNNKIYCRAWVDKTLIVFDYGHLTTKGAKLIVNDFLDKYIRQDKFTTPF